MRTNSITEHFPKIVKDYMVTSFTGQKLDQSFGDQYWEFPDEGGMMKVLDAICDVAEDIIKRNDELESKLVDDNATSEKDERIEELESEKEQLETNIGDLQSRILELEAKLATPWADSPIHDQVKAIEPPPVEKKKRGRKPKVCVACEGSGKNTKGEDCPICTKTVNIHTELKPEDIAGGLIPKFMVEQTLAPPTSTPPWLAQPVVAPVFFAPPPPPPYWNPNA